LPPELAELLEVWPVLSESDKQIVRVIIRAARR
jgi:hypothetical protein